MTIRVKWYSPSEHFPWKSRTFANDCGRAAEAWAEYLRELPGIECVEIKDEDNGTIQG